MTGNIEQEFPNAELRNAILPWSISFVGYSHAQEPSLPPRFHMNELMNKLMSHPRFHMSECINKLMFILEDVSHSRNIKNYTGIK